MVVDTTIILGEGNRIHTHVIFAVARDSCAPNRTRSTCREIRVVTIPGKLETGYFDDSNYVQCTAVDGNKYSSLVQTKLNISSYYYRLGIRYINTGKTTTDIG